MAIRKSSLVIRFTDKTEKYIYPNGEEYTFLPDNSIQSINQDNIKLLLKVDGSKVVNFPNGNKLQVGVDGSIKKIINNS